MSCKSVAVEIGHRQRVRLRETDAELRLFVAVAHQLVFAKRDLADPR